MAFKAKKYFLPIFLVCSWFLGVNGDLWKDIGDRELRSILFDGPFQRYRNLQMFKHGTISLAFQPNPSMPNLQSEFTFCLWIKAFNLERYWILSAPDFGLELSQPHKGHLIVHLKSHRSSFFNLQYQAFKPGIWKHLCVVIKSKDTTHEKTYETIIQVFFNGHMHQNIMEEQPFNLIGRNILRSVTLGGNVDAFLYDDSDGLFRGNLMGLWAVNRAMSEEKIMENMKECKIKEWGNLFDLRDVKTVEEIGKNIFFEKNNAGMYCDGNQEVQMKSQETMNFYDALDLCVDMGGDICAPKVPDTIKAIWMHKEYDKRINAPLNFWGISPYYDCLARTRSKLTYWNVECNRRLNFICCLRELRSFVLRGPCLEENTIDQEYSFSELDNSFLGFSHYKIEKNTFGWRLISQYSKNDTIAFYNSSFLPPLGTKRWYFNRLCNGDVIGERKIMLKLTRCASDEFTCKNGKCLKLTLICNNMVDCTDGSDEEDCETIILSNYRKTFPPSLKKGEDTYPIEIGVQLLSVTNIKEKQNVLNFIFRLKIKWRDPRLLFKNMYRDEFSILTEEEKFSIWTPGISFLNSAHGASRKEVNNRTEIYASVSGYVKHILSPLSDVMDGYIISGKSVVITYVHKYEYTFFCDFTNEAYPFDAGVCSIRMGLGAFLSKRAHLKPMTSLSSNMEGIYLPQFYIKNIYEEVTSDGKGFLVNVRFARLLPNIFLSIFFPTFSLQLISLVILFIPQERSDTILLLTSTTSLVMYSIFQNVSKTMPRTPYNSMMDIWLLFCLVLPFLVFTVEVNDSLMLQGLPKNKKKMKAKEYEDLRKNITLVGKIIVIGLTILFNLVYWGSFVILYMQNI